MKPKKRRVQLSIRLLLLVVTAVAFYFAYFVSLYETQLNVSEDEGAYSGGIPASDDLIKVFGKDENGVTLLVDGLRVTEAPVWKFTDGTAMTVTIQTTLYQQGQIRRYKFHHIAPHEEE